MPDDDEMTEAFFAGKIPAFDAELEAVRDDGRRAMFYSMLRYHLIEVNARLRALKKPPRMEGWVAHAYKAHFGEWPLREWRNMPPIRPNDEVLAAIRMKDNQWRRLKKEERENGTERSMEDSEISDPVQQSAKGIGAMQHGGRVPGVEEQDDGVGELREADE